MLDTNYKSTKNCPFCAETIQVAAIVCRYCGRDLPTANTESLTFDTASHSVAPTQGEGGSSKTLIEQPETVYLQNTDVTVTNTRVLIAGKTYVLANVTSVTLATVPADTSGATAGGCMGLLIGLVAAGVGALFSSSGMEIFGVVVVVISIAGAIQVASTKRTKYYVKLGSSSGESDALWAYNKVYIQRIVNAVNEAIVRRG